MIAFCAALQSALASTRSDPSSIGLSSCDLCIGKNFPVHHPRIRARLLSLQLLRSFAEGSLWLRKDMAGKITEKAHARVGFLGNPSDGYFGKTISFLLQNFSATVSLEPSATLTFVPSPEHDPQEFPSLEALVSCFTPPKSFHYFQHSADIELLSCENPFL